MTPNSLISNAKRIVIKIGSALLVNEETGDIRLEWLHSIASDVSALVQDGKEVIIVSSGAIALGRKSLGIDYTDRPSSIPLDKKQAAAAIGQVIISENYAKYFAKHDVQTALALLSPKDTEERRAHLNARATLITLIQNKVVPIINENDTVSTEEIRFGDNDRLAARVAQMVEADLLIQLSTTDGLYTADPRQDNNAQHIPLIEALNKEIFDMAGDAPAGLSTGGMKSKLQAAQIAMNAGVHMMLADGQNNNPLSQIAKASIFVASSKTISARKKWISSHVSSEGAYILDAGAVQALQSGKSLLPAGVLQVIGEFSHGDLIDILDENKNKLAVGLSTYNAGEARLILGCKSSNIPDLLGYTRGNNLIHRDNLALRVIS